MSYYRVLPRDLFNESKLLKCLGRLTLMIHDGMAGDLEFDLEKEERGFIINQNEDGDLYCKNLFFYYNDEFVHVVSGLNSRGSYPLYFYFEKETNGKLYNYSRESVFEEDGSFTPEFKECFNIN